MFKKILIANRGEIAVRIIRACKELGIGTVAVYSVPDKGSLHVALADEAICIGPANPKESYLNMQNLITAAKATMADAIHPGYGFLAENPAFAELCAQCNITFIGPNPDSIEQMGQKAVAREKMIKAQVPVVPGSSGIVEDIEEGIKIAKEIGFPVLIKATAGGGGKGMRVVQNLEEMEKAMELAKQEALNAFGNSGVYIEKFIEKPRHIEIQILADKHGNIVHLGERECSIQRRHQKLIEEAPSPIIDANLREKIGKTAVKAAKAVNYDSVGTIEFLLDSNNNFYFMEMNTRIQVEHPVTEMITGIDLIKEQIKVAYGLPLSFTQDDIKFTGWSIECRINAEDVSKNFMPTPGKIERLIIPGGYGVRIDSFVYQGYSILPFYDSMVGKIIVWAPNRVEAIKKMDRVLNEFVIEGVSTTIPLAIEILNHPKFVQGDYNTKFLEEEIL
ncbi:acetyl-CoA carboxylase, biotin carboxylase subunit [Anaerobranca californiensis DSM 14826]|jgi:acetyl-CoA carboxylase biotin carboxylase subunit|uniref:Biotin carboxylase n=1 Tax=Anaerobranca californiensis DSM 14826 TaxID=1120989 RepID=A0A1M6PPG4_9FIRM|nr:acetyl-CoA carboxylase biotin carboxylase subunit [Anaerobranca californiensis]SHK09856.1 acetyl-CoA carboxylase, biotin carboxylase subunit [Anaerobranca californiensis DSM 14826]